MTDLTRLGVVVETDGVTELNKNLSELERNANAAGEATDKLTDRTAQMGEAAKRTSVTWSNASREVAERQAVETQKQAEAAAAYQKTADAAQHTGQAVQQAAQQASTSGGMWSQLWVQIAAGVTVAGLVERAFSTLLGVVRAGIADFMEYELVNARLEQSFERVGNRTGMTIQQLQDYASTLENVTGQTEQSILQVTTVLNRMGKLTGDQFRQAQEVVLDMAASMGGSPVTAAEMLARAINQPTVGITYLRRAIPELSASLLENARDMAEAGDEAGATAMVLQHLRDVIGGAAAAQSNTLTGAWNRATDALGDFGRDLVDKTGAADAATVALEAFAATVNAVDTALKDASEVIGPLVREVINLAKEIDDASNISQLLKGDLVILGDAFKNLTTLASGLISGLTDIIRLMRGGEAASDGYRNGMIRASQGIALASGNLAQFILLERQRQALVAAGKAENDQIETRKNAWRQLGANILAVAERYRGVGRVMLDVNEKSKEEERLIRMNTRDRSVEEAGIRAYEQAKKKLLDTTGHFGKVEMEAANGAKEQARALKLVEIQMKETEAAQRKAASARGRGGSQRQEIDEVARATERATASLEDYLQALRDEVKLAGLSSEQREIMVAKLRIEAIAREKNVKLTKDQIDAYEREAETAITTRQAIEKADEQRLQMLEDQKNATEELASTFGDFANDLISDSKNALEALGRLLIKLIEIHIQMKLMAETQGLGGGGGFFSGGIFDILGSFFGGGGGGAFGIPADVPLAKGGVVEAGLLHAARGRMLMKPQIHKNRNQELMTAEQGPEGVFPLQRDAAGNLGIRTGGTSGEPKTVVQIIDQRQSGKQIEKQESQGPNGERTIRLFVRDEMRRAFADGDFDRTMQKNYGMQRNPTRRS